MSVRCPASIDIEYTFFFGWYQNINIQEIVMYGLDLSQFQYHFRNIQDRIKIKCKVRDNVNWKKSVEELVLFVGKTFFIAEKPFI